MNEAICPVCETGNLTPELYDDVLQYGEKRLSVSALERCRCDECGADPILPEQARRNQVRYADARRVSDRLLTGAQIRSIRESLRISQADAAQLFGGGRHGFSKYERGEVTQSVSMDRLLRIMDANYWLLDYLFVLAGMPLRGTQANDASYGGNVTVNLTRGVSLVGRLQGSRTVVTSDSWEPMREVAA